MTNFFVEIVEIDGDVIDRRIEARSERDAEKIDRGANINLNHDRFYTRIVTDNGLLEDDEAIPA